MRVAVRWPAAVRRYRRIAIGCVRLIVFVVALVEVLVLEVIELAAVHLHVVIPRPHLGLPSLSWIRRATCL